MKTFLHTFRITLLLPILLAVIPDSVVSQKGPDKGDNFGYTWTSSDDGGVAFNWFDIKSIGTEITDLNGADDYNVGPFPIGFNFTFYDSTYTDFRVCSNGFITFNSTNSEYSNYALPGASGEMLAAFWNDLRLSTGNSHVYYYNDGSRLIVQYQVIPPYSGTGNYTFQVILYPNGRIVYQYLDMNGSDKSSTIGWQNTDGTDGFTISLDDANFIHNNLAIQIKAGPKTPQNLIAVSGDQTNTLTWDKSVDTTVTKYRIYGGTSPNPTTQIDSNTSVNDTTQMFTGLTNGITYYYRVTSVNDVTSDESGYSNQVSGRPSTRPELFVTNLNDGGVGSLRTAIDSANSHLGPDTICFEYSLKGGDISLVSGGFNLSDNSTLIEGDLDGDGKPDIGINGSNTFGALLTITASNNVIKGLVLHGYYGSGSGNLYITGTSARNNQIIGNYLGTTMDGNSSDGRDFGIQIDGGAKNNKIGDGTINGLNVISGNNGDGIDIYSSDSNYILHNYIGVTSDGLSSAGNSYRGVYLDNSNYVSMTGNVLSGNGWDGIYINRSDSNVILGNFIGTDKDGMYAAGNGQTGITVENSDFNMIGDGTVNGRNVISGNSSNGVSLYEGESGPVTNNKVDGNFIGTAADGFTPLGNSGNGVSLTACCSDVHFNTINHNTIAHNGSSGIYASDYDVRFNTFFQNSIYANGNGGILLDDIQTQEGIAPPRITNVTANSVSGEAAPGALIQVYADDFDQGEIFLDSTFANGSGVWSMSVTVPINRNITALQDSNGSTSAFSFPFTGNSDSLLVSKIADNGSVGTLRIAIEYANYHSGRDSIKFAVPGGSVIDLYGDLPTIIDNQTIINGDLDQNGTPDIMIDGGGGLRSSNGGLVITSSDNVIRGLAIGNCTDTYGGITLDGVGAINNLIVGNYLGTDLTGLAAAPNVYGIAVTNGAARNKIGDGTAFGCNIISGNEGDGIYIYGYFSVSSDSNIIVGNYIGLGKDGQTELGNTGNGIRLYDNASYTLIGDGTAGGGNVISANHNNGVMLEDYTHLAYNSILGNYVGTDAAGTSEKGNSYHGVFFYAGGGGESIEFNSIGDGTAGGRNIISGNGGSGVYIDGENAHDNMVNGNYIGLNASGSTMGNGTDGVTLYGNGYGYMYGTSRDTIINNVISGNDGRGINISNYGMSSSPVHSEHVILGNFIGTNITGMSAIPNGEEGIYMLWTSFNKIGDGTPQGRNVISGNTKAGIFLEEVNTGEDVSDNMIAGNYIGVASDGKTPLGNSLEGVFMNSTPSGQGPASIFSDTLLNNIIANNGSDGVKMSGADVHDIIVHANSIYNNGALGITLFNDPIYGSPQYGLQPPVVDSLGIGNIVYGKAVPNALIQLYKNGQDGEGQHFYDTTRANGIGTWSKAMGNDLIGSFLITALQDSASNTSAFSLPFQLPRGVIVWGTPNPMVFGEVIVGDTLKLSSYGVVSGNGVLFTSSGLDFGTSFHLVGGSPLPDTLFNGDSIKISIQFIPTAAGAFSDTIRLVNNSVLDPFKVVLSGTGKANTAPNGFNVKALVSTLINTRRPTLTWEGRGDVDGDSVKYKLEVSKNANMSSPQFTQSNITDTTFTLTSDLDIVALYYFRVTATDTRGGSTLSNTGFFRTDAQAPTAAIGALTLKVVPIKKYLQVYVATSEKLKTDTVRFVLNNVVDNSHTLSAVGNNVYSTEYELTVTGTLDVRVTGADSAGNFMNQTQNYNIITVSKSEALAFNLDGVELSGAKGSVNEDGFMLVSRTGLESTDHTATLLSQAKRSGTEALEKGNELNGSVINSAWEQIGAGVEIISTVELKKALNLKIAYTEEELTLARVRYPDFDERKVGIYREEGGHWVYEGGQGSGNSITMKLQKSGSLTMFYNPTHEIIPTSLELSQNYPNPFNPSTTIKFGLPDEGRVKLVIYNILGQRVKELLNETRGAGYHTAIWNGKNETGQQVSSGLYIYRLESAKGVQSKKMLLIK